MTAAIVALSASPSGLFWPAARAVFDVDISGRAGGALVVAALIAIAVPPAVSVSAAIATAGRASRLSGSESGPLLRSRLRDVVTAGTVGPPHGTPAVADAIVGAPPDGCVCTSLASRAVLGVGVEGAVPGRGAR